MKRLYYLTITYLSTTILWWYWIWVKRNPKIYADVDRAVKGREYSKAFDSYFLKFCFVMIYLHEFPSVFCLRLGYLSHLRWLLFPFFKPESTVMIHMPENKIGEGLCIAHGNSTVCIAKSIGNNFSIYQQTTIGYSHGGCPVIGNNVTVYAGAKVLGGVLIGDNAVIAANAVVVTDVPENAIMAGVPAKIIGDRDPNDFIM